MSDYKYEQKRDDDACREADMKQMDLDLEEMQLTNNYEATLKAVTKYHNDFIKKLNEVYNEELLQLHRRLK